MRAKCLVLLPGEYRKDGDKIVPSACYLHLLLCEADVVVAVDEDGSTTVIKNRQGEVGKVVPGTWGQAASEGRVWVLYADDGEMFGIFTSCEKAQNWAGENNLIRFSIIPWACE